MHTKYLSRIFLIYFTLLGISTASDKENNRINNKFEAKIAVVDIEAIFEHSIAIKDLKNVISKLSENIHNEIIAKEKELQGMEEQIKKDKENLSEEEFTIKIQKFNEMVSQAQALFQKRKNKLEQAHNSAISTVHQASIKIIKELSKKHEFNIVLPSRQVLFVNNELNLTNKVISELNERLDKININQLEE